MSNNTKAKDPWIAAFWSAFLLGLGQLYAGRKRRGLLILAIYLGWLAVLYYKTQMVLTIPSANFSVKFCIFAFLFLPFLLWVIIDAYLCARSRNRVSGLVPQRSALWAVFMFIVILLVTRLGLSAQLIMNVNRVYVKIYKIKAYAMWPTINNEDSVIVDPNCRTYKKLNRGDVIIFKNPINPRMVFVMRLVAFEGEKVEIKDGWVAVNDRALSGPPFNRFTYVSAGPYGSSSVTIPQKSVYVLGDYNKNSNDSRFWGFVPESYILGKVIKRFTPIQRQGLIE